jgi:2-polyprenyl-3-methyl-5-hydroxy-6-metoxy-1,4-benzoquinol methylase
MFKVFDLIDVNCPVCDSANFKKLFETKDYQFKVTGQVFEVQRCLKCSAGFLSPRPREQDMGDFYNEEFYWAHEGGVTERTAEQLLASRKKQLDVKSQLLARHTPGNILDIGTQKGEFLHFMKNKGWPVEGVEFSETPEKLFDVPIRYGDFMKFDYENKKFDFVTMWAVLEHIYQPREYVQKIHKLMSREGRFIGVVTNMNSIQSRLYGKDDYPRHLTIFTKKSLRKLLESSGFEVVRFWTDQKLFGGSVRGGLVFLIKLILGYSRHEVLAEWNDRNNPMAFCCEIKGRSSWLIKQISRLDKVLLGPLDVVLDWLGFGQNLYWEAIKRSD